MSVDRNEKVACPHFLAVTTSKDADEGAQHRARELASRLGVPLLPRPGGPLSAVIGKTVEALLVVERRGVVLRDTAGAVRWTPGMARLRAHALDLGLPDTLTAVAGFREGESVLDCTLGLAQDALVAARAVGPSGRVVALEASALIYALVSQGLRDHPPGPRSCAIDPVRADAGEFLRAAANDSFDCVLYDPMFGRPIKSQPAFEVLRRYADHSPLTPDILREAVRVARRVVVVKAARYSDDLHKLGLERVAGRRYTDVAWARIAKQPLEHR